jgi:hypothetical protein
VLIAPVSGSRLWKTGIFGVFARDFHGFRSQIVEFWSIETEVKFAKARIWRAFSEVSASDCLAGDAVLIAPVSAEIPC